MAAKRWRGRPRPLSFSIVRSTRPAAIKAWSCSATAVRVTPAARIRLSMVCGSLPTNSLTTRSPAALILASGMDVSPLGPESTWPYFSSKLP